MSDGLEERVRQLGKAGRAVDKLREQARAAANRALHLKKQADEAQREFQRLARELMGDTGNGIRVGDDD